MMKIPSDWLTVVAAVMTLAGAMPLAAQQQPASADQGESPMKVDKAVYLIHASIYEKLEKKDQLAAGNYEIYREREKICQQRWRKMIDELDPEAVYVQLYGDQSILAYARQKLGNRRVITPSSAWDPSVSAEAYHALLADSFLQQLKANNLEMNSETAEWVLAGESFEGCVFTYGGGMASCLGLSKPTVINFDWTVPDARFLCKAELIETFRVGDSPVNAYIFDGPEGYCIGAFLPGLRDHGAKHVTIELADVSKVSVVNKIGTTLFARESSARGCIGPDRDHEGIEVVEGGLQIDVGPSWYILGRSMSRDEFIAAMHSAQVTPAE